MATTLDQATARVRDILQDTGPAKTWPTALLEMFLGEGVRRLAPVCGRRMVVSVAAAADNTTTRYSLASLFGVDEVLALTGAEEARVGACRTFGDTLDVEFAPTQAWEVRGWVAYQTVPELPGALVDAVVYFAASRALRWLVNRGGQSLKRYLVEQGVLEPREVSDVGSAYLQDFLAMREEHGFSEGVGL